MRASWGGKRHGSGRKPKKTLAEVLAHPSARPLEARGGPLEAPSGPPAAVTAPAVLTPEELEIWALQAPYALTAGTLTPGTAYAFGRYCRLVVLERVEADGGGAGKGDHRGIVKLIESAEARFGLVPAGRAMPRPAAAPAVVDPNDAYFAEAPAHGRRA